MTEIVIGTTDSTEKRPSKISTAKMTPYHMQPQKYRLSHVIYLRAEQSKIKALYMKMLIQQYFYEARMIYLAEYNITS